MAFPHNDNSLGGAHPIGFAFRIEPNYERACGTASEILVWYARQSRLFLLTSRMYAETSQLSSGDRHLLEGDLQGSEQRLFWHEDSKPGTLVWICPLLQWPCVPCAICCSYKQMSFPVQLKKMRTLGRMKCSERQSYTISHPRKHSYVNPSSLNKGRQVPWFEISYQTKLLAEVWLGFWFWFFKKALFSRWKVVEGADFQKMWKGDSSWKGKIFLGAQFRQSRCWSPFCRSIFWSRKQLGGLLKDNVSPWRELKIDSLHCSTWRTFEFLKQYFVWGKGWGGL